MDKSIREEINIPNPDQMEAVEPRELVSRGWIYYSSGNYDKAVMDFTRALEKESNADYYFALGLALKSCGHLGLAVEKFESVLRLLPNLDDQTRAHMLKRLTDGHINMIKEGNWNLEKEIWHIVQ